MRKALIPLVLVFTSSLALAEGGHGEQDFSQKPLTTPAGHYSGNTPVDLKHGLTFSNGTYGIPNEDYEAWGKSKNLVPGLSEKTYAYANRKDFLNALHEQIMWGDTSIRNWQQTSDWTKPEAAEYSKQAIAQMEPVLNKLKDATKKADGAGSNDWEAAQSDARKALIEFRVAYTQMHKNVR